MQDGIKPSWLPTNNRDEDEPDGRTARRIAQLMDQHKDKPFFLEVFPDTPLATIFRPLL